MAEIHVLGGSIREGIETKIVVFHYDMSALIAAEGSLVQSDIAQDPDVTGFVSLIPNIDPGELADIQGGSVVEHVSSMRIHATATTQELVIQVFALKDSLQAEVEADFLARYKFYLAQPSRPA